MTTSSEKKRFLGLTILEIVILAILLCVGCVIAGAIFRTFVTRNFLSSEPEATPLPLQPLTKLALDTYQLEAALQTTSHLEWTPYSLCDNDPNPLECYNAAFTSNDGDFLILWLERYSGDDAFNYSIARKVQLSSENQATEIDIPTTVGNHRWLMLGFLGGEPIYYGGADEGVVRIEIMWGRTSSLVVADEAVLTFSRLLDAQIAKIKREKS